MKAIKFSLIILMIPAWVLISCSKEDETETPVENKELIDAWQLKMLDGNAIYMDGTSPYDVTSEVNAELPADMASYNQIYKFEANGTCVLEGENGTYTLTDKTLITKVGNNQMVFTLLSVDNTTLKLQMDKATSRVYAIEVANTLLKEAGDPKNCAEYGIGVTDASFTFTLNKK